MQSPGPIFWPAHVDYDGYCYGWCQPLVCIAGVLQATSREHAEILLNDAIQSDEWQIAKEASSPEPAIVGRCYFSQQGKSSPSNPGIDFFGDVNNSDHRVPTPFIYYVRPRREMMRFYSFDSRELDILPSHESTDVSCPTKRPEISVLTHDFTRPAFMSVPALDSRILGQLNVAELLTDILQRSRLVHPASPKPADSRTSRALANSLVSTTSFAHIYGGFLHDSVETLLSIVLWVQRLLKEISVAVEQLDIRTEQGRFVLAQVPTVSRNRNASFVDSISQYVKFYNCIWLVLNDVIVGVAFGSFLCENNLVLSRMLEHGMQYYLVECVQHALVWLNNWPAGLKLNTELSQFYCHSLLGVVSAWSHILQSLTPHLPTLIWMVGAMGCCGMTMVVSLLSDSLSLLTAHLYICYFMSTAIFRQQLSLAGSLWNLFRGKRYNVLRNRLDSWDYDMDQLLLGTILFTLVAFLYPTIFTYYALFATTRLAVIMIHATLDTVSALLNHFPLFALMLRYKDPMRIPGRITIAHSPSQLDKFVLENQAAPLSSIFVHYAHLGSRLYSYYHPLRLMRLLITGRRITPIPRSLIRFSMIATRT
ncbi:N-acetylglucosaminyl-phosphatidylinositol biosynthetic protein [Sparassis crispa]|uniref:N-acetylglucosaminyl-phosphatidylinositol biosynthetic protein n=1 Tax=Sparassis crispa TaxID=139825 RepID=A0A401GMV9_9APHY|nr:N-acetylglucosaminyl-phosphatidylinositol biosynthetic protein [Sparassis crispa]GBE83546.1 N-acetylglucosaminyl-phosphatidylinositol biosynthetic protein [Sparassis crispa]